MPELDTGEQTPLNCEYCGKPLDNRYYFCLNCSMPYTKVEYVLPRVSVPYLSDEKKVAMLAPSAIRIFWMYFSLILGGGVLGMLIFGADSSETSLNVFFSILFSCFTIVIAIFYFKTLKPQLGKIGFLHPAAWIGFPILAGLLLINWLYHIKLIELVGLSDLLDDSKYSDIFPTYGALILFVAVVPAIFEELAYRGLIQHWLQDALSPTKAVIFASALFSLSHFSVYSFPYLFAVGVLLGWLKLKTGSLYPSILIHFLHNWYVVTYFS